jgi:nucleoid DNA-binding protein
MNSKITLTDVSDQLSESAKISKKDANAFLKTLFDLIEESLLTDKIVKINGLGTFKLVWVADRRIANVNTGESQEIPGHYKTTFSPDSKLAVSVNEPFAHLETMYLDEATIADEPIESSPKKTQPIEIQKIEPSEIQEEIIPIDVENELIETPNLTEETESIIAEESEEKPETTTIHTEGKSETPQKKSNILTYLFATMGVISFGILLCIGYHNCKLPFFEVQMAPVVAVAKPATPVIKSTPADTIAKNDSAATAPKQTVVSVPTKSVNQKDVAPETKIIATEMIREGSRLTLLSLKYYGSKAFWVYIYDANKQKIKNPNNVAAGTLISIPDKSAYNIDANNPESVKKANELATQIASK